MIVDDDRKWFVLVGGPYHATEKLVHDGRLELVLPHPEHPNLTVRYERRSGVYFLQDKESSP